MKRRRFLFPLAAILLLGLGAYFMGRGDEPEKRPEAQQVHFPTHLRSEEYQRLAKRRTLRPEIAKALAQAAQPDAEPPPRRDPMLAALPPAAPGKTAVVFEANALRNSPIGELMLDCMRKQHGQNPFDEFQKDTHVDPLVDIDRVAVTSDGMMVSGNFTNANWDFLFNHKVSPTSYGQSGQIYVSPSEDSEVGAVGIWNNEMFLTGKDVASVQAAIDRLEGRTPPGPQLISEEDTYGEVYGVISPSDLGAMFGSDNKELAAKLSEVASEVKLHVDAQSDVAMVADLSGPDAEKVSDLGKSLGGVLSLARLKAQAEGDQDLAQLLDLAEVDPESGSFRAKLALPMSLLEQKLAWCREKSDAGAP